MTYALGSNTVLRANVSSYSETRETQDNWFGSDWKKWSDGNEVQSYLGFESDWDTGDTTEAGEKIYGQGWSPFISRFSQKENYMINGMSFSRPVTRSVDYSKSAYS